MSIWKELCERRNNKNEHDTIILLTRDFDKLRAVFDSIDKDAIYQWEGWKESELRKTLKALGAIDDKAE